MKLLATGWKTRLPFPEVAGILLAVQADELSKTDLNKLSRLFVCELLLNV
jgi:hypothetical protein